MCISAGKAACSSSDGVWEFFTRVLHPSSVGTAIGFGVPVIAPDLPAIREMTHNYPCLLYPPQDGPGSTLAVVEKHRFPASARRPGTGGDQRWRQIGAAYRRLATELWENR